MSFHKLIRMLFVQQIWVPQKWKLQLTFMVSQNKYFALSDPKFFGGYFARDSVEKIHTYTVEKDGIYYDIGVWA